MKSIRAYLLRRLLGGSAALIVIAGAAVFAVVANSLRQEFDSQLSARITQLASLVFQEGERIDFEFSDQLMPDYSRAVPPAYFEIRYLDGRLLERSKSLRGGALELAGAPRETPTHWSSALPDGRDGRYVSQLVEVHHVSPEEGPHRPIAARFQFVVASGVEELRAVEARVLIECSIGAVVLMSLIGIVAWTCVRKGLEPAGRLAAQLGAIDAARVPAHLSLGEWPDELRPMAETAEDLVRRLGNALERERRTTADIAHEMRTPLAELLTASEVALRNGHDPLGERRALETVRDVALRLARSVSTILKLARLDVAAEKGVAEKLVAEPVDLARLVDETLRSLEPLERKRDLRVQRSLESPSPIEADPDVLRIVVSNLLANALQYAPVGSSVVCRLERQESGWSFAVENPAGDLRAEDLASLGERFWRRDGARADRERTGLGLALSRALAEKSGLQLRFELADAIFRATLSRRAFAAR